MNTNRASETIIKPAGDRRLEVQEGGGGGGGGVLLHFFLHFLFLPL